MCRWMLHVEAILYARRYGLGPVADRLAAEFAAANPHLIDPEPPPPPSERDRFGF